MTDFNWTATFGEVKTAAQWTDLGDNDRALQDGTGIDNGAITEAKLAAGLSPITRANDVGIDWVASGCVWSGDSYGASLNGSMTSGVIYVSGIRVAVSAVSGRAFTASKDTYVDIDSSGSITYTEVSNNAASPSLTAGSIRIAIIVTGAASIASVASINQGQIEKVLPIASSTPYTKTDSLGNIICNRNANGGLIGYRFVAVGHAPVGGTYTYPELLCPVIVPTGRQIRVTASILFGETNTTTSNSSVVYAREDGSNITTPAGCGFCVGTAAATNVSSPIATVHRNPSAGLHTYGAAAYLQGRNMSISNGWVAVNLV